VTFNGADYLCNSCADQLPQSEKATPCTPPPSLNGLDGGDVGVAGGGVATSTPVRAGHGIGDGQLGSPVSDVSDISNESEYSMGRWKGLLIHFLAGGESQDDNCTGALWDGKLLCVRLQYRNVGNIF